MQFYLSEILNKPILNKTGERIGTINDVVISDMSRPTPISTGFVIKRSGRRENVFVSSADIDTITPKKIQQSTDVVDLTPFKRRDDEVLLYNDVYDKQIVDIDDRRLTRVNDLLLESQKQELHLKGVDVSARGIFRRLGIPEVLQIIKSNVIDWEDVQFLGGNVPVKFNIHYKNLETLHPVDIGRIIIEGPGYKQGSKVLSKLKDPIAADIVEELSPIQQRNLLGSMEIADVADVIEHMSPDKAADLLLNMGPAFAQKVMPHVKKEDTKNIQTLLSYPEHTTGAFMTTDYLVVPQTTSVDEVGKYLNELDEIPDFTYYIYIVQNNLSNILVGTISIHECLMADKRTRLSAIMKKRILVASPHDHIKKSLRRMYRYNISAIPVISKPDGKILGILTFKDAMNAYLPNKWKNKVRRVFSSEENR